MNKMTSYILKTFHLIVIGESMKDILQNGPFNHSKNNKSTIFHDLKNIKASKNPQRKQQKICNEK